MSCHQSPDLHLSVCRRVTLFLTGALECMLFGGAVFGWPQLVHLLKMDSIYSNLCSDVNTAGGEGINQYQAVEWGQMFNNSRCISLNVTPIFLTGHKVGVEQCAPQDERFALIFTLAVGCYGIPSVLVGYLLHHAGLWVTRITAGVMLCVGFIFLGITTQEEPNWLIPSIMLLALGGNQIRMSSLQLADLFPAHKATAITILSSSFAVSAALFLVFQITERYRIERATVCWVLAGLSTCIIWMTFLMPVHHVPYDDDIGPKFHSDGSPFSEETTQLDPTLADYWISKPDDTSAASVKAARLEGPVKLKTFKDLSLMGAALSLSSILHQLWLSAHLLAINIYQMTYNYWITVVSCSPKEAEIFSVAYSYVNFASVFVAPLLGLLVDFLVARARDTGRSYRALRTKEVQSNIIPILVTSIATFCMYLCLLFFHPIGVYISLGCMALARPCIVSVSTAYLRIRFPAEHFNRLVGIHYSIASVITMLQYPQFQWSQQMYLAAHGTVLLLLAVSMSNPLHLMVRPLFLRTVGSPRQAQGGSQGDKRALTSKSL